MSSVLRSLHIHGFLVSSVAIRRPMAPSDSIGTCGLHRMSHANCISSQDDQRGQCQSQPGLPMTWAAVVAAMFAAEFQDIGLGMLTLQASHPRHTAKAGSHWWWVPARGCSGSRGMRRWGPAIFEEEERTPAKQCLQSRCGRYRDTGGWDWRRKKNALEILAVDNCGFDPWTVGNVRHSTLWHLQTPGTNWPVFSGQVWYPGTTIMMS
jgi:hypothetical protein